MDNDLERMQILQMIEDGRISAEEGLLLLKSLNEDGADPEFEDLDQAAIEPAARPDDLYPRDEPQVVVEPAYTQSMPDGLPAAAARWRRWWTIPLWIGAGVDRYWQPVACTRPSNPPAELASGSCALQSPS